MNLIWSYWAVVGVMADKSRLPLATFPTEEGAKAHIARCLTPGEDGKTPADILGIIPEILPVTLSLPMPETLKAVLEALYVHLLSGKPEDRVILVRSLSKILDRED